MGPDERYAIAIECLASTDGKHFTRCHTETGASYWEVATPAVGRRVEWSGTAPRSYLVMVDEYCSFVLTPGANGLFVRDFRLLGAVRAQVTAQITPGAQAPDWLPNESEHLLFSGDRMAAAAVGERYIPLDGMVDERTWPSGGVAPLDLLAVALGRSVARANATLAATTTAGGTAILSGITLRVGVSQVDMGRGRVMVTLAQPDQGEAQQFVELTMNAAVNGGGAGGNDESG